MPLKCKGSFRIQGTVKTGARVFKGPKSSFVSAIGKRKCDKDDVHYGYDSVKDVKAAKISENGSVGTDGWKDLVFRFVFTFLKSVYDDLLARVPPESEEKSDFQEMVSDAVCICWHVVNSKGGEGEVTFLKEFEFSVWKKVGRVGIFSHSLKLAVCSLGIAFKMVSGCDSAGPWYKELLLNHYGPRAAEACGMHKNIGLSMLYFHRVMYDLLHDIYESSFDDNDELIRDEIGEGGLVEFESKVFMWYCNSKTFSTEQEDRFRQSFILYLENMLH